MCKEDVQIACPISLDTLGYEKKKEAEEVSSHPLQLPERMVQRGGAWFSPQSQDKKNPRVAAREV